MDSCINYLRSYIYKWVLIILIASYYVSFRNIIYQPLKILLKLSARICCFRATSVGSGCFGQFTQHSSVMGFAPQGTLLSAFVVPHACVALVQDTYSTFPDLQKIHEKIKVFGKSSYCTYLFNSRRQATICLHRLVPALQEHLRTQLAIESVSFKSTLCGI